MVDKQIVVNIKNGLHARPAAEFVKKMAALQSTIEIDTGDQKVNAKSILTLMSASIKEGQTIRVIVEGDDEEEAIKQVEDFFQAG